MSEVIQFNTNLIDLEMHGNDCESILARSVDLMIKQKLVEEEYKNQVINREREFPTAIEFPDIVVALSHGDPIGVNDSAMAIVRCVDHPVFRRMEDPDAEINVDVVVLLAVNHPNSHIKVLANLMDALAKPEVCTLLKEGKNPEEIFNVLTEELLRKEICYE